MAAMQSLDLPKTPNEKLSKARELKEEGNVLFKAEQWRSASKKYHYSLLYAKGLLEAMPTAGANSLMSVIMSKQNNGVEVTPEIREEAIRLSITLSNNLAVCMLKMERWENVIKHATSVIKYQPENVKALYRRGTAYMKMGRLDESKDDLQQAMKLDPCDNGVRNQYTALLESFKDYWTGEKLKYQGMFGATSQHSPTSICNND